MEKPVRFVMLEEPAPQKLPVVSALWALPDEVETIHILLTTRNMEMEIVLERGQHEDLYEFLIQECGPLDATTTPAHLRSRLSGGDQKS